MTSTTSSISKNKELKETYLWSLKKNKGIAALLTLLMFMAMPMLLMIALSDKVNSNYTFMTPGRWVQSYNRCIFTTATFFVIPLILVFTVIISVSLFSYMHKKRSVDLFHALPIGRVPMLLGRLLAGITLICIPVILNFAIVFIIGAFYPVNLASCFGNIISYMLWIILISIASLIFTAFMAVCTGTTFDMVISVLGINLGYPLIIFLGNTLVSCILPGYGSKVEIGSVFLTALSPFAAAFMPILNFHKIETTSIFPAFYIWWIIFSVILLAGTIVLYKKRKSECAETGFAFPIPKIIIRFLITAVAGLGIGLILGLNSNSINFFIGVISGSVAAHIVVEAIYSRGFKQLKKSFIYYGLFLAAFFITYTILITGCFGYDTRVPQADEVQSISINTRWCSDSYFYNDEGSKIGDFAPLIKQSKNIQNIIANHKQVISEKRAERYPYSLNGNSHNPNFSIIYNLKSGKTLKRYFNYSSYEENEYDKLLKPIVKLKEFRQTADIIYYINAENIKSITIDINDKSNTFSPDLKTKEEFLKALQKDNLDCKTESFTSDDKLPKFNILLDYKKSVNIKDTKLQPLLNDYNGKIRLDGNFYKIYTNSSKTGELIKKLGWNK